MTWHSIEQILAMHAERLDAIEQRLPPVPKPEPAPLPGAVTTPGRMTFTVLERK